MEWLLCVDAFAAEPAVKAVKMGFAPVIVSPGDGLGDSVGWDHKGAFCFIVVFPEDRHHFGIHLDFSYRILRLWMKELGWLDPNCVLLEPKC